MIIFVPWEENQFYQIRFIQKDNKKKQLNTENAGDKTQKWRQLFRQQKASIDKVYINIVDG